MINLFKKKADRQSDRAATRVVFFIHHQGQKANAILNDISETGIGFASDMPLAPGTQIEVNIMLTYSKTPGRMENIQLKTPVEIRWHKESKEKVARSTYGGVFPNLTSDTFKQLSQLVGHLQCQ